LFKHFTNIILIFYSIIMAHSNLALTSMVIVHFTLSQFINAVSNELPMSDVTN